MQNLFEIPLFTMIISANNLLNM